MSIVALAARLPDPQTIIAWSQSLAMLDAIMCPEWDDRYFSYDASWAPGEQVARMRTSTGDDYSFTITPHGTYGRGFDHESAFSPYTFDPVRPHVGLLDNIPEMLRKAVYEPAFLLDDVPAVSLTLWRLERDSAWSYGASSEVEPGWPNDDGGTWLFDELNGNPESYAAYATEYYEVPVDLDAVKHIFDHRALTDAIVQALNPDLRLQDLTDDIRTIGYSQA